MTNTTIEYHIFRVKLIKPKQKTLFYIESTPREIFEFGLNSRPYKETRKNKVWHIGNLEYIEDGGGRFAIGRTTKATLEKFDEPSGNFIEELDDSGPYTFAYFDSVIGLIGIAKKSKVATDINVIANKIALLLESTHLANINGVQVLVVPIPDPEHFLQKIQSAYAVKKFKADFTGPNPVDADALFQKPISIYCKQINGEFGSVEVKGVALDKETVQEVAKSTAATGSLASAVIVKERGDRPIGISFQGETIKIALAQDVEKSTVLKEIRKAYNQVRV